MSAPPPYGTPVTGTPVTGTPVAGTPVAGYPVAGTAQVGEPMAAPVTGSAGYPQAATAGYPPSSSYPAAQPAYPLSPPQPVFAGQLPTQPSAGVC